jgi:hypothetical protein
VRWTLPVVATIVLSFAPPLRAATDASTFAPSDVNVEASASDASIDAMEEPIAQTAAIEAPAPAVSSAPPPVTSASASPVAHAADGSPVRLRDKRVFVIRVERAGVPAAERARRASAALERAVTEETDEGIDVRVEEQNGVSVVIAGKTPIVELGLEDAVAAGDASVQVTAASVAGQVRSALKSERTRSAVAKTAFSWSLVVLSGLVVFLLLRRAREIAKKGRDWVTDNPKRLPALRVGAVELMRPAAFQGAIRVAISLLERALQLFALYVWLVFSLSLFESTRDVSKRVTGFVIHPIGVLVGRAAEALPLFVVGLVAIGAVLLLVRFVGLLFGSVARGETTLSWLPQDLALPVGVIVRFGIIVAALLLGGPLVTGSDEGATARAGLVFLGAIGLAGVPVLATGIVGAVMVIGRRLREGDFVSIDGRQGRIARLTLFEAIVHDGEGAEMRVPHLVFVIKPFRALGPTPLATLDLVLDPKASPVKVREVLAKAAEGKHGPPRVRLLAIDADGARWEVVARRAPDEQDVATRVAQALAEAGIGYGRTVPLR